MKDLARRLTGNGLEKLNVARTDVLPCAAVRSTTELEDGRGLEGRLDPSSAATRSYAVPNVPVDWPAGSGAWKDAIEAGAFNYQPTFPSFDERDDLPPRHLGLQDVVLKMLELYN